MRAMRKTCGAGFRQILGAFLVEHGKRYVYMSKIL